MPPPSGPAPDATSYDLLSAADVGIGTAMPVATEDHVAGIGPLDPPCNQQKAEVLREQPPAVDLQNVGAMLDPSLVHQKNLLDAHYAAEAAGFASVGGGSGGGTLNGGGSVADEERTSGRAQALHQPSTHHDQATSALVAQSDRTTSVGHQQLDEDLVPTDENVLLETGTTFVGVAGADGETRPGELAPAGLQEDLHTTIPHTTAAPPTLLQQQQLPSSTPEQDELELEKALARGPGGILRISKKPKNGLGGFF